ncbi:homoserine kinase [Kocuria turfanensis]|uniref:Homoserine kinase n=1 Tax=Kocuria turfanensis TaxID=388357 RepID=A0A512I8N4_9MICC|nr:homoserine kinase [Kocuria turfanensis]GEO94058.1 homoserine kinase [Kocuria turfanensis]
MFEIGQRVELSVPGSTGNVGPGYDSLGLALGHYDDLAVTVTEAGLEFELHGEGSQAVPRTAEHLVVRAMRAAFRAAGVEHLPGLRLEATNRIPHGRGMGSSASAVVAGVLAANALLPAGRALDDRQLLQVAAAMEGHPDNVAPSLYGGLVISWSGPEGYRSAPVTVHEDVMPVVAIPDYEVPTRLARSLLPATVPHHDASVNAGRTALLVEALTRRPELLLPATEDRLHQPYRASAMPPSARLMADLRERGLPAMISGAGPTVLVLAAGAAQAEATEGALAELVPAGAGAAGVSWRVLRLRVDGQGAKLEKHPQKIQG